MGIVDEKDAENPLLCFPARNNCFQRRWSRVYCMHTHTQKEENILLYFIFVLCFFLFPLLYQLGTNATLWSTPSGMGMQTSPPRTGSSYVSNAALFLCFHPPFPPFWATYMVLVLIRRGTLQAGALAASVLELSLRGVLKCDFCWWNHLFQVKFS